VKRRRALLSVSDKTGIVELARELANRGFEVLSTGGTQRLIAQAGVPVIEVASATGFPEMMDGRVKTLHPMIHGGILALRDEPAHVAAMQQHGIAPIDIVAVNLYPFERTVAREEVSLEEAIEQIDIGGPSMVRSAAKNHAHVAVVVDPSDYPALIEALAVHGEIPAALRRRLALKAFQATARYDAAISSWLAQREEFVEPGSVPAQWLLGGSAGTSLRYGENPHQRAAFYRCSGTSEASIAGGEVLGGKELSFNNILDLDAALALVKEFAEPAAAVIKHTNPCGCALGANLAEAISAAWEGDPLSAFGSVIGLNRTLDVGTAEFLVSDGRFVECIVAPEIDPAALEILRERPKWGRNVRIVRVGAFDPRTRDARDRDVKKVVGGFLVQDRDLLIEDPAAWKVATKRRPSAEELASAAFAWSVCKHLKSNAIALARGRSLVGAGAGQMSRVDSVEIACKKAGVRARGAALASDAFFPFPDGVEAAAAAGVEVFVQPGGSRKDDDVIAACDRLGVAMLLTDVRHFRH
jgi:phosphoribosylaminoimidazolecarboxamide formyltransferase/IMP cyclohydrolase